MYLVILHACMHEFKCHKITVLLKNKTMAYATVFIKYCL